MRTTTRQTEIHWRDELCPLAAVLALAALFFLLFFNRFAGLRSGDGEFAGGLAFLAGRLPYRDYFTAGPPLNQLKSALELAVFGKTLLSARACGVAERLLIAALLYLWLRLSFSRLATATAAFVTIVVSAGDRTDPIASYNHDAILFAILCGLSAALALRHRKNIAAFLALALASGGCAALSALAKQTVGLGVLAGVLIISGLAIASMGNARRSMLWAVGFLVGATIPILAVAVFLQHLGVLQAAVQMLFISGPKAKAGHPGAFLTREFAIALDNWPWVLLAAIAAAMSAPAIRRNLFSKAGPESTNRRLPPVMLTGLGLIVFAALLALTPLPAVWNFSKGPVYYAFAGTAIVAVAAILLALGRNGPGADPERLWTIALLATTGWCVAFTLSLSWPAFEAMTLPGLGLLLAAAIDGVRRGRPVLYALLAVTVFFQVREKLDLPFSFDNEDEPSVRFATQASTLPALRGMRLPPETLRLLERTTDAMQTRAHGRETVFTFPEMSLLYSLSDRLPSTFAGSHNIDTTNDQLARDEARRLLANQPVVILYAHPTEQQLRDAEATWRDGAPSGQRDLIRVLDCLTAHDQLADTFRLTPDSDPIQLYVKPASDNTPAPCGF